jgi:hypothetical protein
MISGGCPRIVALHQTVLFHMDELIIRRPVEYDHSLDVIRRPVHDHTPDPNTFSTVDGVRTLAEEVNRTNRVESDGIVDDSDAVSL